jgi:serine/threonine-protein phosphatase 2A activator
MDPSTSSALLPRRCIYNDDDLQHFIDSPTKRSLMHFTETLGNACMNTNSNYKYDPQHPLQGLSPGMACLHGALEGLEQWVQEDDASSETPSATYRFGNPRFRSVWHARLLQRSVPIVSAILAAAKEEDTSLEAAHQAGLAAAQSVDTTESSKEEANSTANINELSLYLHDAFGHPVRLDYGTGHETSFHIFLYALSQLHVMGQPPLSIERCQAVALSIYHQYLRVTRALQTRYHLEPAGSHGVWGLDDFHCLPFYFGACQLAATEQQSDDDAHFTPQSIQDAAILSSPAADQYLYFSCIRFIRTIKTNVPFFESSPMLNDISHLPSWQKVAKGLLKLYDGEVLRQRPVVQHLLFGTLFPCTWTPSPPPPAAPTEAFRSGAVVGMEATRAPWARDK